MDNKVISEKVEHIFVIINEIMNSPGNEDKKLDISKTVFSEFIQFYIDLNNYTNTWDFIHILLYHYFKSNQEDMCKFIISSSKTILENLKNNKEFNSLMFSLLSDCCNYIEDPEEYSSCVNLIKLVLDEGIKAGLKAGCNISDYDFSAQKEYLEQCKEITEHLRSLGVNLNFLTEK
jgi:hypothetical protein